MIKIAGETQVTISATGRTSVVIWTTKLDDNLDKPVLEIPIPRQKSAMDSDEAPSSFLIDIGRIKQLITVQGILIDEVTEAAQEKKTNLQNIIKFERAITITWGTGSRQQTATGNINKCMITEGPGIVGTQKSGYESEKRFDVQLSLIVGTDK